MKKINNPSSFVLSLIYGFGFLLVCADFIANNFFNTKLCETSGCQVVESFVYGGNDVLLAFGAVLFALLFVSNWKGYRTLQSLLLALALPAEGYLLGFQSFIIKQFCLFCLIVFSCLFVATLVNFFFAKRYEFRYALIGLAAVFVVTFLVNPRIPTIPNSLTLIYSESCPHCKDVIQFCEQKGVPVNLVEVKQSVGLMHSLNLDSVPVLFCTDGSKRKVVVGAEEIKKCLMQKVEPKATSKALPVSAKNAPEKPNKNKEENKIKENKTSELKQPVQIPEVKSPALFEDQHTCSVFQKANPCGE